ncbi:MAG: hydantoinase/oxoprolinase family protein, partial [Planctomycetes bacterium]|nr:hydantoinase/oxoprolinase family protein [Planctomycetota bacterium]
RLDEVYQKRYGRTYPETEIEFVTFKVRVSEPQRPFRLPELSSQAGHLDEAQKGSRPAFCMSRKDFVSHAVYDRMKLAPGASMTGPAIIEERESTIIIGSGASARVDDMGFVWIDL